MTKKELAIYSMLLFTNLLFLLPRGGTESTRHAVQLINALIQDPAKELEDLIPRNHIRQPGTSTRMGSTHTTSTASSTTVASSRGLPPAVPPSAAAIAAQQGGKLGKNMSASGVRPPFVSLPLAYTHPQLALLAMQQIRHPRLPMAQFGGTFTPSPNTWGPFPVRPVSPGSANGSPKHNGTNGGGTAAPRPSPAGSAHLEHASPSAGANGATPNTPPVSATAVPTSVAPSTHTPSSARKQLFPTEPKTGSAQQPAAATAAPAPAASSVPAAQTPTTPVTFAPTVRRTPPLPPASFTSQAQQQQQATQTVSKREHTFSSANGKEKPLAEPLVAVASALSEGPVSAARLQSSPTPQPTLHTQGDIRPQVPSSFSTAEPGVAAVSQTCAPLPVSRPVPTSASNNGVHTHIAATISQYATSAPGVTPRMANAASVYPIGTGVPMQEQQAVFVPPGPPQELHKPQPPQPNQSPIGMAPPSLPTSSAVGLMNGSHMHPQGGKAQMPPNFGPNNLFNHFGSIFESNQVGQNHVWGGCQLPNRTPPEQPYSAPPAYVDDAGQLDGVLNPADGSKAPGYRCPPQKMAAPSPIGEKRYNLPPHIISEKSIGTTVPHSWKRDYFIHINAHVSSVA